MFKKLILKRRLIQGIFAFSLYFIIAYFQISLLYVLIFGSILGIIFGKVFCRWMCPVGYIMELMVKGNLDNRKQQMYMYHKLGCPIAWISGYLNKYSLFKIKRDVSLCTNCGKCDKVCYISSLNKDYSLYKKNKENPTNNFSCSKCLECVSECPTGSLSYTAK